MKEQTKKNRSILISGSSITGPALAYWLSRYGFQPTIVEIAPTLRTGGYKVDIRGRAIDVAERMGILPAIWQASCNMREGTIVDSQNQPIATLPANLLNYREGRDDEIVRGELSRILYAQTHNDVEYLFGDSITSLVQNEDCVKVTFKHAAPRTFDLVVGADGLHSNVRMLAFGDEAKFINYLGAYVSIFTTPNFFHLDHQELYYYTPGKVVGIYAGDGADAKSFFYFASPQLSYDYHDSEQQKKILYERFRGDGGPTAQLLSALGDTPDFYFDSLSQIHLQHLSTGRVVLVGDAAYCASPGSGQGTSLALVGAYVLAGELAAAAGDYRLAFARYENEMHSYVEANQKLGIQGAKDSFPHTQLEILLRNQITRILPHLPGKGFVAAKLSRTTQVAANAISLKDYEN
ncbi:FAD-dependent oxidoreductase [Ktedonosporobacter rubrisoli]|uniref:FAD-dependent oxidoreductase n=1 Tax=Ktedonosporobacter rubrisoli TaxID=2509675 RepID=A0A4P6JUE7_KTERU|nr:FAD-dependent monooxygenase [Ktedonosporobacter rubrisoli]QBD78953.1 FAD-dependent oxidoreductase [Ktedonosporobacter rubrisoli]